jgi:hypothetical protein
MASEGFSRENPLPVLQLHTDGDRTRKYIMRCKNHPELLFRSKDPGVSRIFFDSDDCSCPLADLEVIGREK